MKTVKLSDGLIDNLIEEISERIKAGLVNPKSTLPRELLKAYRAMTTEEREASLTPATSADLELLGKLLDAEEVDGQEPTIAEVDPVVISLTPRLSMAIRWEAMMFDRTPEAQAIIHIAESVKDVTGDYFSSERTALSWLKEGSAAEGVLEEYLDDARQEREEAAS